MRSSGLIELEAVLAVARLRSFRAAATELGMSTSALSHAVAALETRMGVRLFHRTTRSVSLSEAGEQFVASVAPAMGQIRGAIEQAGEHRDTPSGTLRINTSAGAAWQCMPMLVAFLRRYPQMKLDIVTEGKLVDIVAGGFDAGIRLTELVPQDMVAVSLGAPQEFAVVGSPAYFEAHGEPRVPTDLAHHVCVRNRLPSGGVYRWEFEKRGEAVAVDVQGPITLDEPRLIVEAARASLCLAYLNLWNVQPDLERGTLRRTLVDWTPPYEGLALYYPGHRHVPAGLRALIGVIKDMRGPG